MEGTAGVLNRVHMADDDYCNSVMLFEKGLSDILQLHFSETPCVFRGLMLSSTKKHTAHFYGDTYVLSKCQTYEESTTKNASENSAHGYMAFTKMSDGKLKFGAPPEKITEKSTVLSAVTGDLVDKVISQKVSYQTMISSFSTNGNADENNKPFTDAIKVCLTMNACEQFCGN